MFNDQCYDEAIGGQNYDDLVEDAFDDDDDDDDDGEW